MTRAMFVTVLHRLAGSPAHFAHEGGGAERRGLFTDVPQGIWYDTAVQWAASEGLVNGTSTTTFSPDADISLEQMITVLYRYNQGLGVWDQGSEDEGNKTNSQFSTFNSQLAEESSDWAIDAMNWAVEQGLFNNIAGILAAKNAATRAQVAAILMNYGSS